jgi:hypothetical protein
MCTVLLSPGVLPIAVNKYIIYYHIGTDWWQVLWVWEHDLRQIVVVGTWLITLTSYGNMIYHKLWLWEHSLCQVLAKGTWFVTSSGYGNSIYEKEWLREHDLWQVIVMGTICDKLWLQEHMWQVMARGTRHVTRTCYGNSTIICDKYW